MRRWTVLITLLACAPKPEDSAEPRDRDSTTPMDSAGDSAEIGTHDVPGEDGALHQHPTFRLFLDAPEGEFGEGTVSFKLEGDPGNATSYGESETYTLHVSNGYLPENANLVPLDGARCQKAVAKEVRVFVGKQYKTMASCLDTIQDFKAKGGDLGTPSNAVLAKCSTDPVKGLLAKIAADRAKALEKASAKCTGTFETVAISSHLGMAQCRNQELLSGAYASATGKFAPSTQGAVCSPLKEEITATPLELTVSPLPSKPATARSRSRFAPGATSRFMILRRSGWTIMVRSREKRKRFPAAPIFASAMLLRKLWCRSPTVPATTPTGAGSTALASDSSARPSEAAGAAAGPR